MQQYDNGPHEKVEKWDEEADTAWNHFVGLAQKTPGARNLDAWAPH